MPTIITGSPLGIGLSQAGAAVGDYADWLDKRKDSEVRRRALDSETNRRDAVLAHEQEQWGVEREQRDADQRAGEMLPALMDQGEGEAGVAPGAVAGGAASGAISALSAPSSAQRFGYQRDELGLMHKRNMDIANKLAPEIGKLSPSMRAYVTQRMMEAGQRERDELDKRHAMESLQYMNERGAWGDKGGEFAQHALATAAGLVQAGKIDEAFDAARDAAKTVSARMQEQQIHDEEFAKHAGELQQIEQFNQLNPGMAVGTDPATNTHVMREARMLLDLFRTGGVTNAEFQRQWPHVLKGEVETSDGAWMPRPAAAVHEQLLTRLKQAAVTNAEAGSETRESKVRKDRTDFIAKLVAGGSSIDKARAAADKEFPAEPADPFSKQGRSPSPFAKQGEPEPEGEPVEDPTKNIAEPIGQQEIELDKHDDQTPIGAMGPDGKRFTGEVPEEQMSKRAAYLQQLLAPTDNDAEIAEKLGFADEASYRRYKVAHAAELVKRWKITEWVKKKKQAAPGQSFEERLYRGTKFPVN